jgi:hypothetical protein
MLSTSFTLGLPKDAPDRRLLADVLISMDASYGVSIADIRSSDILLEPARCLLNDRPKGKESVARQTELGWYLKNPSPESHSGE